MSGMMFGFWGVDDDDNELGYCPTEPFVRPFADLPSREELPGLLVEQPERVKKTLHERAFELKPQCQRLLVRLLDTRKGKSLAAATDNATEPRCDCGTASVCCRVPRKDWQDLLDLAWAQGYFDAEGDSHDLRVAAAEAREQVVLAMLEEIDTLPARRKYPAEKWKATAHSGLLSEPKFFGFQAALKGPEWDALEAKLSRRSDESRTSREGGG